MCTSTVLSTRCHSCVFIPGFKTCPGIPVSVTVKCFGWSCVQCFFVDDTILRWSMTSSTDRNSQISVALSFKTILKAAWFKKGYWKILEPIFMCKIYSVPYKVLVHIAVLYTRLWNVYMCLIKVNDFKYNTTVPVKSLHYTVTWSLI